MPPPPPVMKLNLDGMAELRALSGVEFDLAFLEMLSMHHAQAVFMAGSSRRAGTTRSHCA